MQINLFCFPYAGGSAVNFSTWRNYLPNFISPIPIENPGHLSNLSQVLMTDLPSLLHYFMLLLRDRLATPYCFYGHSLGALISFELVRYLRRHHLPLPMHLFVSGQKAPHFFAKHQLISHLPDQEFLAQLKKLYGGISEQFMESVELHNIFLPMLRADYKILESYHYNNEAPLACAITAIAGISDPVVNAKQLFGWQEHTASEFNAKFLLGDHFSFLKEPAELIQIIHTELTADVS